MRPALLRQQMARSKPPAWMDHQPAWPLPGQMDNQVATTPAWLTIGRYFAKVNTECELA
jgi:hypothetical protein